jgi:hypothetical protein
MQQLKVLAYRLIIDGFQLAAVFFSQPTQCIRFV